MTDYTQILARFLAERGAAAPPWSHESTDFWCLVEHATAARPEQGWKLHVSANLHAADEILARVLAVLADTAVCFKFARSSEQLAALNGGAGSNSQIGKFVTVYPADDAQAVALALDLDRATEGASGPVIASDRPLRPGSLVHYRYGAFGSAVLQTKIGAIVPTLQTPEGELVPDPRGAAFEPPAWVDDPFVAAGVVVLAPARSRLLAGRYFRTGTMHSSPTSEVSLAVDIEAGRRCVIKALRDDLTLGDTDIPASMLLEHEAEILRALAGPQLPVVHDCFRAEGHAYLVLEDIEGETFERTIAMRRETQVPVTSSEIAGWAAELASTLAYLHGRGHAYLDLKPTNVIVTPMGLRLIDFDAVTPLGEQLERSRGTRGYVSPERAASSTFVVSEREDVHALGALLYLAATGAEPSQASDPLDLLARPLARMAPRLDPRLATILERCLAREPRERFADMHELLAALGAGEPFVDRPAPALGASAAKLDPRRYLERARALAATLVAVARPVAGGEGLAWTSSHSTGAGLASRDLNSGGAGALLGLCELADEFRTPELLATLRRGALGLARAPRPAGDPLPGLYVGEGGVIAALLRAGQVLDDHEWIAVASERANALAQLPFDSPDLFNGTAGRLRVHLWVYAQTGDAGQLDAAKRCGEALLASATIDAEGDWSWIIPPGYEGMSGDAYLGYAHGAAGIADALLDLWQLTHDEGLVEAVRGVASWCSRLAVDVDEGRGVAWPARAGDPPAACHWCHGATGIGLFMARAGAAGLVPEGLVWAKRAAYSASRATRWASATQCHGLAGNIEFLLEVHELTHDPNLLTEAAELAELMDALRREREGLLMWPSESASVCSPDYMVGYVGVATCLLRLARPSRGAMLHRAPGSAIEPTRALAS